MSTEKDQSPINKRQKRAKFASVLRQNPEIITLPVSFVVLIGLWELGAKAFNVPTFILPAPSLIWKAFTSGWRSGIFGFHTLFTLKEISLGFGIAVFWGLFFGAIVAQWRLVEKTLYPYLVAIESIPKIALAPILTVWFGLGLESKVALAALVGFFPILVNTIQGLVTVDEMQLDLLRSLGAGKWQTFWKLRAPNALPFIFTGFETASVLCVLGAITAEFVGSKSGLGSLILQYQFIMETPSFFAVVVILGVLGLSFNGIIGFLKKKIVFWLDFSAEKSVDVTTSM